MFKFTIQKIAKALDGFIKNIENPNLSINKIVIDNREVERNCAFVAIVGKNFDGHIFCKNAIKKGALFAVVEKEIENIPQIVVKNTRHSFLKLAALNRSKFKEKLTAITGSVGKTTTKDMLAQILNSFLKTLKTYKNLNNDIGLPKTILNLDETYNACVVELGMSNFKEIETLSKVCKPSIGIITNIGTSHIEFLKTKENILKAKLEILEGMEKNSYLILNNDDELLKNVETTSHKIIRCGIKNSSALYTAKNITQFSLSTKYELYKKNKFLSEISLPTIGEHNVLNSILAIAAAELYGASIEQIKYSLEKFTPSDMRQNIYNINGIIAIADFYNASPESMKAAIKTIFKIESKKKYAVLGDMLELGAISKTEHIKIGEFAVKNKIDFLYCYGKEAYNIYEGGKTEKEKNNSDCKIEYFLNKNELINSLKQNLKKGDVVLFKASRAMNFENIFNETFSF